MSSHEFKVVPAPDRAAKLKGLKRGEDPFSLSLSNLMNEMGQDGWDYVRAETLPVRKRSWWRGTVKGTQNVLVFRRRDPDPVDVARIHTEMKIAPRRVTNTTAVDAVRRGDRKIATRPVLVDGRLAKDCVSSIALINA